MSHRPPYEYRLQYLSKLIELQHDKIQQCEDEIEQITYFARGEPGEPFPSYAVDDIEWNKHQQQIYQKQLQQYEQEYTDLLVRLTHFLKSSVKTRPYSGVLTLNSDWQPQPIHHGDHSVHQQISEFQNIEISTLNATGRLRVTAFGIQL